MPADSDATPRASRFAWPLLAALGLAWGIAALAGESAGEPTGSADPLRGAQQLVLVTTGGWDENQGILRRFERPDDSTQWREVAAFPVSIGRNGSAWGTGLHAAGDQDEGPRKREGDGRSPAGVFALGTAFGYADTVASGLPYQAMTRDDWCMDVPASPLYNRIVDSRDVGAAAVQGSTEPMRLDLHNNGDDRYKLGFVIEHNAGNVPGMGSCIFAHLWGNPDKTTAGCTAMPETGMRALLGWLQPAARPVFVQLTDADYDRLQAGWRLPSRAAFR